MRANIIRMMFGLIVIAVAVSSADAQMSGCMGGPGGGMHGSGMMMEGMGQRDMGMMQGMGGGMHGYGMMGDNHPVWKHVMGLGLDDKQKEALKALRTRTMKDMVKKNADMQLAVIDLGSLLDKDQVDMKAVEALAKKKESIRTDLFLAHIRMHEDIKALLTPDQKKKLKEMMEPEHGAGSMGCREMMHGDAGYRGMHSGEMREAAPPAYEHMH